MLGEPHSQVQTESSTGQYDQEASDGGVVKCSWTPVPAPVGLSVPLESVLLAAIGAIGHQAVLGTTVGTGRGRPRPRP